MQEENRQELNSLIDDYEELSARFDAKQKSQRRQERYEIWADRTLFMVIGAMISVIYLGFQWYSFKYLTSELWNKLIAWCLT